MLLQHVCIFLHADNIRVTYTSAIIIESVIMITKSAVPLFVIITGSVLLDSRREFPYQKGLKYAFRMIKIIVFWNIVNAFYFFLNDGLKAGIGKLIYGNYWYLYMLVGLYLLMPIVNLLIKDYKETKIPVYVIVLTLVYELWLSYSLLIPESIYGYASKFVGKFMFSLITGYSGFLLLGYVVKKDYSSLNFRSKKAIAIEVIIGSLMIVLLIYAVIMAVKNNDYNHIYFDEFTAFTIGGIIFCLFQKQRTSEIMGGGRLKFRKILLFIGTHSLGIYVVSNIILDVYKRNMLAIEAFPFTLLGMLVCWLMLIIPSCLIVYIVSKTSLKWII